MASEGMHRNYKQNRKLGNQNRDHKNKQKALYNDTLKGVKVKDVRMSPEAYAAFQEQLRLRKRADQKRLLLLSMVLLAVVVLTAVFAKRLLGL